MAEESETVKWDDEEWSPAERVIEEWAVSVLAGSGVTVIWRDRPRRNNIQVPYLELAFGPEVAIGQDDIDYAANDAGGLDVTITGAREVMLSAQLRTRDQRTFGMARRYLGKLRQSLQHPAYVQLFESAGLGVVDCEPLRVIPSNSTTRVESISLLEVKLSLVQEYADAEADKQLDVAELVEVGVEIDENPVELVEVDLNIEEEPEGP